MQLYYFFVEGSIGAGKSTLLHRTETRLRQLGIRNLVVVPEPLHLWTDVDGINLLELFYQDPKRWAYTFQVHAMSTRVVAVRQAIDQARCDAAFPVVVLCERSIYTDRFVFVETLVHDGIMIAAEKAAYIRAFEFFGAHAYPGHLAGVIYLRSTPNTCHRQMCERDRTEEATVTLDYLEKLHQQHERAITDPTTWHRANRLILDVERLGRINDSESAADTCAQELYTFITKETSANIINNEPRT